MPDKDCFGQYWEEQHPECVGGRDPVNPGITHSRCELYDQCSRVFKMNKAQEKLEELKKTSHLPPQTVPVTHLTRPYYPPNTTQVPTQTIQSRYAQQYTVPAQPVQPVQPQFPFSRPAQVAPTQAAPSGMLPPQFYPAVFHPAQSLLPLEAPPYLTTGEPLAEEIPTWKRIIAESLRAAAKGVMQQAAFIADHTTFFPPKKG